MIHLKSITKTRAPAGYSQRFPFNIAVIRALDTLAFSAAVTFFVGENGSGKSTLIEAIASAVGSITVGSEGVQTDPTLQDVGRLGAALKLAWTRRTRKGFFLRAEDFFGYARRLAQIRYEYEQDLAGINQEYQGRSEYARGLARMPYMRDLQAMEQMYGEGLDAISHGESFLSLFQSRFIPGGLYLLDEPEAPLSPMRQLSLISLLKEMVAQDAQFIIATHSPILMAFPGAEILNFDTVPIQSIPYHELEHVTLTRSFLEDPQAYLRHL